MWNTRSNTVYNEIIRYCFVEVIMYYKFALLAFSLSAMLALSGCGAYIVADDPYYDSSPSFYYRYGPSYPSAVIIEKNHRHNRAFYGGISIGNRHLFH